MHKVTFLVQRVNHNEDVGISYINKPNNMVQPLYKAKTMQVQGKQLKTHQTWKVYSSVISKHIKQGWGLAENEKTLKAFAQKSGILQRCLPTDMTII